MGEAPTPEEEDHCLQKNLEEEDRCLQRNLYEVGLAPVIQSPINGQEVQETDTMVVDSVIGITEDQQNQTAPNGRITTV